LPPRSKVITILPPQIRKEVERRMLAKRFSDYEGLAQWVREQGYDISDDSLWRYGKALKREFTSARFTLLQARLLADWAPDSRGRVMQAVIQIVQHKLLSALAEIEKGDDNRLYRLVQAVADLTRVSVMQQQWASEVKRQKQERRRREEAEFFAEDLREIDWEEEANADLGADQDEPNNSRESERK
jgi:hypothetical protein